MKCKCQYPSDECDGCLNSPKFILACIETYSPHYEYIGNRIKPYLRVWASRPGIICQGLISDWEKGLCLTLQLSANFIAAIKIVITAHTIQPLLLRYLLVCAYSVFVSPRFSVCQSSHERFDVDSFNTHKQRTKQQQQYDLWIHFKRISNVD